MEKHDFWAGGRLVKNMESESALLENVKRNA